MRNAGDISRFHSSFAESCRYTEGFVTDACSSELSGRPDKYLHAISSYRLLRYGVRMPKSPRRNLVSACSGRLAGTNLGLVSGEHGKSIVPTNRISTARSFLTAYLAFLRPNRSRPGSRNAG